MKCNIPGLRLAGCIVIAVMLTSCKQKNKPVPPKGFEKIKAPKEAFSQLKNPDPIQEKENLSVDKIPMGNHSFLFLAAGKPISEDINQTGEVISVSEKEMVIKSLEKGELTMRYALPGELRIPVKTGENFSIDFRHRYYLNSMGYTLVNYTRNEFVHASGKISNADTIRVVLSKDIYIYQAPGKKIEERKSDFGIVRDIPVFLNVNGRSIILTPGKAQEVDINKTMFTVFVLYSNEMQSSEEKRSSSEGDGFNLEYVMVKK